MYNDIQMKNLTQGDIRKQLTAFAIPMLIGTLFQQINSLADTIIVGRFIDGNSVAAVGISLGVSMFLIASVTGLTTGSSIVISQYYGAKQYDKLKLAVSTSVIFLTVLSLIITLLGVLFTAEILQILNAPENIFADAHSYMQIIMAGIIFTVFYNLYTAYLRALGDAKTPLYTLIISSVLNIIVNIILVVIFGYGLRVTAATTVGAKALATLLCFIYVRYRQPLLRIKKLAFNKEMLKIILKYGIPAAIQLSIVTLAGLTVARLVNSFGSAAAAGITLAGKIDQIALMPIITISAALATFVAQNMGADQDERAVEGFKIATTQMFILAVIISICLFLITPILFRLFIYSGDPNVVEINFVGQSYLRIMVIFYFLFAFLFGFNGFFRGAGDAVIAMAFPIISLAIRVASAYALVYWANMGPEALAWSIPIGWSLSSILSYIYYKKGLWKGKIVTNINKEKVAVNN